MTTALNVCRKEDRKARRRGVLLGDSGGGWVGPPGPERVDVIAALSGLPERRRQAVILYYWGGFPTAVVAELMGISEGGVRAHLTYAREDLRSALEVADA
jgi:DNA-directed RNA polymerase specialized sigma24 family protein